MYSVCLFIYLFTSHLMRILGWKRCEVTGGWRNLHIEELHSLYFSPNIITMQQLGKHIPEKRTHATEGCPLLGNGPVNTPP
jgi:hypothetical protein